MVLGDRGEAEEVRGPERQHTQRDEQDDERAGRRDNKKETEGVSRVVRCELRPLDFVKNERNFLLKNVFFTLMPMARTKLFKRLGLFCC